MSVLERELKKAVLEIDYYFKNQNLDYSFKSKGISLTLKTYEQIAPLAISMKNLSPEVLVELAEVCHSESACTKIADEVLKIFFDLNPNFVNKNNFYIRGLFVRAQIEARSISTKKAEEAMSVLKYALSYIIKGLEIIAKPENKIKYAFLSFNASVIAYDIIKAYLKPNWSKNFSEVLEKVSAMLEEADDVDFNWRVRILMKLAQSYLDAERKTDWTKPLDKIADILKKKGEVDFYEELLRFRIFLGRDNSGLLANLKKEAEAYTSNPSLKFIHTLQSIKCGAIADNNLEKEVQSLIAVLQSNQSNTGNNTGNNTNKSIKLDSWKADILAELAFILIKKETKYQTMSKNIYESLVNSRSNTLKGKLFLENLRAILVLNKLDSDLKTIYFTEEESAKRKLETRIDAIKILDRNLSALSRINDSDLANETCMQLFNTAIPFMKKSLRKHYQKAFLSATELLESTLSNESSLRASLHFELAKCFLDEDLLSEADTHLIKALSQDYSIPLSKLTNYKPNEPNTNVNYLQRNLEGFLAYAKRSVTVKTNIYGDPDGLTDLVIFETDSIKNSKNEEIKSQKIKLLIEKVKKFNFEEFKIDVNANIREKDLVEEEIASLKQNYELKILDDKKHLTLALLDIAKMAFDLRDFQSVLDILGEVNKWNIWTPSKDLEQILALAEYNLLCAACYEEYLVDMEVEIGTSELVYFNIDADSPKDTSEATKTKVVSLKNNMLSHLKESCKLAVSISQHWFVFNIAVRLWNALLPIITLPNFTSICNEAVMNPMADIFEALNSAISFYESLNYEYSDSEYFEKVDIFVNFTAIYAKLLEVRGRPDECIRICDVLLTRRLNSNKRKVFDTIKARALKADTGGKKVPANTNKAKTGGKTTNAATPFVPSPEMVAVSECFATLETARISKDEKSKLEMLKKGLDILKNIKSVKQDDESQLELKTELWYKYGVQYFLLDSFTGFKYSLLCAENCVKTYEGDKPPCSETLLKWYSLGFLLYGDSIYKIVDKDKQERLSQIKLYFTSIDKIVQSAMIAETCSSPYVILQGFKAFYSVVIQVMDQPQSREALFKRFLNLHKILLNNRQHANVLYADSEFLLLFYSIFCMCINEVKDWTLGESVVSEALKMIPSNLHHFLLEHKLFYYSKLGKNFLQGPNPEKGEEKKKKSKKEQMNNSANSKDIITKAKLYNKLARSSTDPKAQFEAFNRAIDLLKNDQNVMVSDVMFELATWMYKRNYQFEDIEDNLLQAADILLEIEPIFEDEEDLEDSSGSLHSKRSTASRKSRISKRSRSKLSESKKKSSSVSGKGRSSRVNRSTISSDKKTKTIFAKLLECDPYPLFLNTQHLESLFKIHVLLGISADDSKKKLSYLLDAFYLLNKIIEISFKTMNCIEFYEKNKEEIAKMAYGDDLNPLVSLINHYFISKELNIPQIYTLPDSMDSWITFNFPESFLKKITEENESHNLPLGTFFCRKAFDKPFQFFYYLNYLIEVFMNETYFHTQSVLLIKFAVLFSEYVLSDLDLKYMYVLKLKRLMHIILVMDNTVSQDTMNSINSNLNSLSLPLMTQEKKWKFREELRKVEINLIYDEKFLEDDVVCVIDSLKPHVVWILLSIEFCNCGYFNYAKDLLEESIFHCLVLKDKSNFIKANLILSQIYFIESDFKSSFALLNKLQLINSDVEILYEILMTITNIFDHLKKHAELIAYIQSLSMYLNKTSIDKFYKEKLSNYMVLSEIKGKLKRVLVDNLENNQMTNSELLNLFTHELLPNLRKYEGKIDSVRKVNMILEIIEISLDVLINNNSQFSYISYEELYSLNNEILGKALITLAKSEVFLNSLQTLVPSRIESSIYYLPVHRLLGIVKILFAKINNLIGQFKFTLKKSNRKVDSSLEVNEEVRTLLMSLDKEIREINEETDKEYQRSISVLNSTESLIPQTSNEYVKYLIEKINSYRLQALSKKEMKGLWDLDTLNLVKQYESGSDAKYIFPPSHQRALNSISQFENEIASTLTKRNYTMTSQLFPEMLKYYFNVLECSGLLNIELTMKSLCDYQNIQSKIFFNDVLQRYLDPACKDWVTFTTENLARKKFNSFSFSPSLSSLPDSIMNYQKVISELPYIKNLGLSTLSWTEIKSLLPNNSAYLIFQMTEDKSVLYLAFIHCKDGSPTYELKKLLVPSDTNLKIDEMIKNLKLMKHQFIKSVIITSDDLNRIYDDYNPLVKNIVKELEESLSFSFIFKELDKIINPVLSSEENPVESSKKNVTVTKGKVTNAPANENLNLPSSGIESITFLIDHRFADLPFDVMPVFSKIPFKSFDFSIQTLVTRPKTSGVNPVKYYFDYMNKMPIKKDIKKIVESKLSTSVGKDKKSADQSVNEGIFSWEHFPSIPEMQKLFTSSGSFIFASQTSFLYQYPPYEVLDCSKFSKCNSVVLLDRISNMKNYVDQKSLVPSNFSFSFQPLDMIALFTLIGCSSVVTTRWSLTFDEASEFLEDLVEENSKGMPLSYALNTYRNPKTKKVEATPKETEPKSKKQGKEQTKETVIEDTIPPVIINKKEIFGLSPIIYGLSTHKLN